jgi:zona occludens toxin (predicted ATPase)
MGKTRMDNPETQTTLGRRPRKKTIYKIKRRTQQIKKLEQSKTNKKTKQTNKQTLKMSHNTT